MQLPSIIQELLKKKGVQKLTELSPDEKTEYDRWQAVIEGSEITVPKIKEFCESQVRLIEGRYASGDATDKQDIMLRASLHIYLNLIKLIDSPEIERNNLEKYLTTLLRQ